MFDLRTAPGESSGRVLVVAALDRELAALKRRSPSTLALLETGEGSGNAAAAVSQWLVGKRPRAVLGIGYAGSLSASLKIGDLVIGRESRAFGCESIPATQSLLEAAHRIHRGGFPLKIGVTLTVGEIICRADKKRELAATLSRDEIGCVDMESWAVARVCADRHLPFLVARCVSDLLDEDLPLDFNQCRGSDGRVSPWKVLSSAGARPAAFKGLWELRRRAALCSEVLAEFVGRMDAEMNLIGLESR